MSDPSNYKTNQNIIHVSFRGKFSQNKQIKSGEHVRYFYTKYLPFSSFKIRSPSNNELLIHYICYIVQQVLVLYSIEVQRKSIHVIVTSFNIITYNKAYNIMLFIDFQLEMS